MSEPLSHQFIAALEPARDELYALALAAQETPAKAEAKLQQAARELFAEFARSPHLAVVDAFRLKLGSTAAFASSPMPADVWSRLSATIQLEAAKSAESRALNPDSVLLSPDPLLAPRKTPPAEPGEGLDLPGPSRFLLGSVIVIIIGILLTIYILTRPVAPHPAPPTSAPAATEHAP